MKDLEVFWRMITFRIVELGPPIPAPPPTVNAWDKPLRTGSPSTNVSSSITVSSSSTAVSATSNSTTVVQEKR